MQYYTILTDVTVLVSIKEGKKILKGIKHVLGTNATVNCNLQEIERVRLKLYMFRVVFENLFSLLKRKSHTESVLYSIEKKTFVRLVNKTLSLMEVSVETKWDIIKENCNEIIKELSRLNDAYVGNNQLRMKSEFNLYYFDLPLMYMNTLYDFYKTYIYTNESDF